MTGAAATPEALKAWYRKFDIELQEVYGMTETCGGSVMMPKGIKKPKSTGKPLANVELAIEETTGEIKMKMPWLMNGYYKNEAKTAEILKDGWLHTGDKGHIDEDGYLYITGRVSDTFKSSKGKYILPAPLEQDFAENEYLEQICVVGLGISQPIALCLLSEIGKKEDKVNIEQRLLNNLNLANKEKASYTKISTIVLIDDDWTVDNQILTPTMKVRRSKIDENYEQFYEKWHEAEDVIIWQ